MMGTLYFIVYLHSAKITALRVYGEIIKYMYFRNVIPAFYFLPSIFIIAARMCTTEN